MAQSSNSKVHKQFQGRHVDTPSKGNETVCNKVIEIQRKRQLFDILPNSCTAMISAILLAAGESNRMGQPKQLMPFGQSTIVERTIDNLLNSAVSETIVALGYRDEEIRRTIAGKPVKLVINPDYQQGMSASIIAGLKQIDKKARAVLIALGDQPFVDSQTISSLVEAFIANNRGIIIPVYQGKEEIPLSSLLSIKMNF
jgi:CTP:molybdopterin cytidylyltransferase MocA